MARRPRAVISVLVSLAAEAGGRVDEVVADARDRGYSWDQIASRLAISVAAARRRHAGYAAWRRGMLFDERGGSRAARRGLALSGLGGRESRVALIG